MDEVQLIFFYITIICTKYIRHELQYYNLPIYLNLKSNLHRYIFHGYYTEGYIIVNKNNCQIFNYH